jgi:hypothetical protein
VEELKEMLEELLGQVNVSLAPAPTGVPLQ